MKLPESAGGEVSLFLTVQEHSFLIDIIALAWQIRIEKLHNLIIRDSMNKATPEELEELVELTNVEPVYSTLLPKLLAAGDIE